MNGAQSELKGLLNIYQGYTMNNLQFLDNFVAIHIYYSYMNKCCFRLDMAMCLR